MKKEKLIIYANGDNNWIGGIYYCRNILFQLLQNKSIVEKFEFVIYTKSEFLKFFLCFEDKVKIEVIFGQKSIVSKYYNLVKIICGGVGYIFPYNTHKLNLLNFKTIHWIPDFQHHYYPQYFSKEELNIRNDSFSRIKNSVSPVVLSSEDCKRDFQRFYGFKSNIYVVPFVSYVVPELRLMSDEYVQKVIDKYRLTNKRYACIMNQFWQHKNHIVVLNAIRKYVISNPDTDFKFVFTGRLEDYRNPSYIEKIKTIFNEDIIKKYCVLLGFIDREEQIVLMKQSKYVIQPSLFEGWGTVLEDAKVLDKTVLLSDIPVHREQMNDKCILFDPHDPITLANLIKEENQKEHIEDIEKGIADMQVRAREYSKGFEQLLKDFERKKLR